MQPSGWLDPSAAFELLSLGGPVVAVLGVLSVFGLAIVLLKLWQFASVRLGDRSFVEPALADWQAGRARRPWTPSRAGAIPSPGPWPPPCAACAPGWTRRWCARKPPG